jgi:hypothetical protein
VEIDEKIEVFDKNIAAVYLDVDKDSKSPNNLVSCSFNQKTESN